MCSHDLARSATLPLGQGHAIEQPSEEAPSMGKSITDLSSVTTVGLDLAKHVFQVSLR